MIALFILTQSALCIELGAGVRNDLNNETGVDSPHLVIHQAISEFSAEATVSYGFRDGPGSSGNALVDRSVATGRDDEFRVRRDRLAVALMGSWDPIGRHDEDLAVSGAPFLTAGAELRSWEVSTYGRGPRFSVAEVGESSNGVAVGPVMGAGVHLEVDRMRFRVSVLDRTLIAAAPTFAASSPSPIAWTHTPTLSVDALVNTRRSK